jgi:ABC-2 type transport system ATP-binding protein
VAIIRRGRIVALEEIASLLAHRKRRVELRLRPGASLPDLGAIPGVSGVAVHDGLVTCQLEGDVEPFVRVLGGLAVRDVTIEPAHLEEAFLEFYEGEDPPNGDRDTEVAAVVAGPAAGPPRPPAGPPAGRDGVSGR